jgi:hypothetical protein
MGITHQRISQQRISHQQTVALKSGKGFPHGRVRDGNHAPANLAPANLAPADGCFEEREGIPAWEGARWESRTSESCTSGLSGPADVVSANRQD